MSTIPEPPTREPSNEELWSQPPANATQPALPVPAAPAPPAPAGVVPLPPSETRKSGGTLALAITSLAIGIPLSAIAADTTGLPGLIVTWIGIVGVNGVVAWGKRSSGNA